jgi:chromosome segregation ATPase
MAEVAAERDQLRAEFAIERRRIEQANEALVVIRAKDLSELGRRGARIAALAGEVEAVGARVRSLEASLTQAEVRAGEAEGALFALEKEVQDSAALATRRLEDSVALQRGILAANDLAEMRRAQIAGLETQVEGLQAELEGVRRELAQTNLKLAEKTSAAELFAKERDFARSDLAAASQRRDALQQEVEDLAGRAAQLEQELREAQRARARMANEIADQARALEGAKATEAEMRVQSAQALTAQREEARRNAERVHDLRAERDSLHGALEAVRREMQTLRDELGKARSEQGGRGEREDEILRQAISDLGAEVLRLTGALERQQEAEGTPAERVQRLQARAGRASSLV